MTRVVHDEAVEPVVRVLLGAMDVDGGATDEQRAVLDALTSGLWSDHPLDPRALAPIEPDDAGAAIPRREDRQRALELLILFELCRHPVSPAQVSRTEAYAAAIDVSGHGLTLGYEYVEFYRRNELTLPGDDPSSPAVFVSHDMCHVIGGYEPTGPGEIALGAMQLAVADNDAHWIQFLGNLGVHEAGYLAQHVVPKQATLARPGAAAMLAEAFRRGEACTGDFTAADHLAMVELPLADVRARFGVPPIADRR